ncbi:pyridine nucleotide-disulfide oxidoreductase family protein [Purpureocillium lavendulum]|uniref:Pyridine nucleotide-disulfide oxidoreductase family protein n=1 Tax=Purpureocillium lavendulum TaxID=1247861 RepID=A0AB34FWC9_9HYPO|nr:pyridine nucleotide-disulfide oxidoreductase family protein [Purpureocillium lavendulum]
MAKNQGTQSQASFVKQCSSFVNSVAGLDLSLRLIQAVAQVVSEVFIDGLVSKRCSVAAFQLALARRYLRFFSFIDCLDRVTTLSNFDTRSWGSASHTLEVVEASCLGAYFALEDLTMLHDMDVLRVSWYTPILVEANKFWFYAICASLARNLGELLTGSFQEAESAKVHAEGQKAESTTTERTPQRASRVQLLQRLVIDSCDITLPTSFIGWVALGDLQVGLAMIVSSLLAWPALWVAAQQRGRD